MTVDDAWEWVRKQSEGRPKLKRELRAMADDGSLDQFLDHCLVVLKDTPPVLQSRWLFDNVMARFRFHRASHWHDDVDITVHTQMAIQETPSLWIYANPERKMQISQLREHILKKYGPLWLVYLEGSISLLDLRACLGVPLHRLLVVEKGVTKQLRRWWHRT